MSVSDFEALIAAYCAAATNKLQKLKSALPCELPLLQHIRGEKLAPPAGSSGGVMYRIHGGGVWLRDSQGEVDVELGEDDFSEAFDAWRLHLFAEARPRFADYRELELVRTLHKRAP